MMTVLVGLVLKMMVGVIPVVALELQNFYKKYLSDIKTETWAKKISGLNTLRIYIQTYVSY